MSSPVAPRRSSSFRPDLPFVSPEAIDAVLAALPVDGARAVSRSRTGTERGPTRSSCGRPTMIDVAFGAASRQAHRRLAEAAGVAVVELPASPLTVDLDTPEDLVFVETTAPERIGAA